MRLVQLALRVREDGLVHGGPPCSSWVWVNRHTSQRCVDNPEGDSSVESVAMANEILAGIVSVYIYYIYIYHHYIIDRVYLYYQQT